ncbi:hypothetical protein ABGB16_33910, partial [Micromonospora sp. B11E3]|uniref:hypothetical protein n=1 Tax=Micromonospora sp. B11E3 TaxID=3153562 RepID=UPI00325E12B6
MDQIGTGPIRRQRRHRETPATPVDEVQLLLRHIHDRTGIEPQPDQLRTRLVIPLPDPPRIQETSLGDNTAPRNTLVAETISQPRQHLPI